MSRKKSPKGNALIKVKGLFDHINQLRLERNPKYFDKLTDADKRTWSNYMVCRFLSMQPEMLEYINELQKYANILSPRDFYLVLLEIVPKGKAWYPYIKNQSEKAWSKELLKLLRNHYQESERNVIEYLELLRTEDLRKIVGLYGFTEEEIEKLISSER